MSTRSPFRRAGAFGLVAAILSLATLSLAMTAQAAMARKAEIAPSIVGYWVGEKPATPNREKPRGEEEEYYAPADLRMMTPQVWRVLQADRVPLYLHVRYGRDFGPTPAGVRSDALALVRKANSLGIPVVAWVVIPYDQGYWAYQGNAQANFDAVKSWAAWQRANRLRFESVVLDQEFSWQNLKAYVPLVTDKDPQKFAAWMEGHIDPEAQCAALSTYRDLISWGHGQGIRVDAAVAPMVTDDLADGDIALQNALQISATSRYDRMYLMAYRSAVSQAGFDPGQPYIAGHYAAMRQYFGAAGEVSLGIPGHAPYDSLTPLADDIRLLAGLGARAIPIFSLEEMVHAFGPEGIRTLAEAARRPMDAAEIARVSKPTPGSEAIQAMSSAQNAKATELALAVLKRQGGGQSPNRWPDGCGDSSVAPLAGN